MPLIHTEIRPDVGRAWFSAQGVDARRVTGVMYDQLSTIKQAALHGLGVALLPEYLVQRYIAAGRIAAAWGGPTPTPGPYCVVWSASKVKDGALTKFLNWLATQTGEDDLLP